MLTIETRPRDIPTDDEVAAIVAKIQYWRAVDPHQRTALRVAVASLPLLEAPTTPPVVDQPRHWRVAEVAQLLRMSTQTVRTMLADGRLVGYRLSDSPRAEWRVRDADLQAFVKAAAQ